MAAAPRDPRADDPTRPDPWSISDLPEHPSRLAPELLLRDCTMTPGRASGPGGQHRNKVQTKVTLLHEPTGLSAHASERRSAAENHREALFRLRLLLATRIRTAPAPQDRWGDVRPEFWRARVDAAGKVACNSAHEDYPAMLSLALDVIAQSGLDPRKAALRLACTPSQLIRLVKDHAPAFEAWNAARTAKGEHGLK
jgi:hypothetical protein